MCAGSREKPELDENSHVARVGRRTGTMAWLDGTTFLADEHLAGAMERVAPDEGTQQENVSDCKDRALAAATGASDPSAEPCRQQYCSFAVTGRSEAFQAIYVCYTCCEEDSSRAKCVCQACADACHADHDGLEFVGMGPSYCDCNSMFRSDQEPICQIVQSSEAEAKRLNLAVHSGLSNGVTEEGAFPSSYRMDAYAIPELDDESLAGYLCDCAKELIRHSKETFWIDPSDDRSAYCDLERLAYAIYKKHSGNHQQFSGAEWWVQVKPISTRATSEEAVDMHYDKDEQVAETFGLGCFPLFSTVTYLTGRGIESKQSSTFQAQAPTVVLSRRYDDEGESGSDSTSLVFLSHPRRGKHILFDGRLLHGAPAHMALRERATVGKATHGEPSQTPGTCHRVTFLVNLWSGHKPAGVSLLPDVIRGKLKNVKPRAADQQVPNSAACVFFDRLDFQALPVPERSVTAADIESRKPMYLPFVGKNATWGTEEDEEGELVVSMSVPPLDGLDDTVLFRFVDAAICPSLISPTPPESEDEV